MVFLSDKLKKNLKFLNKVINKKVQTLTYYGFQKKFFQNFLITTY